MSGNIGRGRASYLCCGVDKDIEPLVPLKGELSRRRVSSSHNEARRELEGVAIVFELSDRDQVLRSSVRQTDLVKIERVPLLVA
jgi:hypothetical protein